MGTSIALLIIGIILVVINYRSIQKDKKSFQGILNDESSNMKDFQVEIGKLRREFAETLLEIQTQLIEIESSIDLKKCEIKSENVKEKIYNNDKINKIDKHDDNENNEEKIDEKNSVKMKEIEKLIGEGHTVEEIADILKMGKGEILLIKELYLK